MVHHLNNNKQFMVLNAILAFAVIIVVVIFVYMSLRLQREREGQRYFAETYTFTLEKGFEGDSLSLFVNDSLITSLRAGNSPLTVQVGRFAEQSALMIVDNATDYVSVFELSDKGGTYRFEKADGEVKQLEQ